MGEIGTPRLEYLYDLTYCDIILITRGYWRRQHPSWEQARLIAYQARYCMGLGKNETAKTVTQWLPFPWEKERLNELPMTDDEMAELQAEMDAINAQPVVQEVNPAP